MSWIEVTLECLVDGNRDEHLKELGLDVKQETEFRKGYIKSKEIISFYQASDDSIYKSLIETVTTTYGVKETIDDIRSQL